MFAAEGFLAAVVDRQQPNIRPIGWQQLIDRETKGAADAAHDDDVLFYRRPDGRMHSVFKLRKSR